MLGSNPIGLDIGDYDTLAAAAGDLTGRSKREAEPWHCGARTVARRGGRRAGLALGRQFAEADRKGPLLTAAQHRQLDR